MCHSLCLSCLWWTWVRTKRRGRRALLWLRALVWIAASAVKTPSQDTSLCTAGTSAGQLNNCYLFRKEKYVCKYVLLPLTGDSVSSIHLCTGGLLCLWRMRRRVSSLFKSRLQTQRHAYHPSSLTEACLQNGLASENFIRKKKKNLFPKITGVVFESTVNKIHN